MLFLPRDIQTNLHIECTRQILHKYIPDFIEASSFKQKSYYSSLVAQLLVLAQYK